MVRYTEETSSWGEGQFIPHPLQHVMSNHNIFDDAEPPPSYEEAVVGSSRNNQRPPPPPTPPRSPTSYHNHAHNHSKPNGTQTTPTTPGGRASSSSSLPTTPQTPAAQTFQQILPQPRVNRQFPPAFNLYRNPLSTRASFSLGEHQSTPIYAVTTWAGWSAQAHAQANLVLHNGPSEDNPPLANVAYGSPARRMDVFLPPLPGRPARPVSVQVPGPMRARFAFSVEVPWPGGPGGYRAEAFEWRRSNSLAVGSLGGRSQGWKLVRLSNELPPGGVTVAGSGPPSNDNHEVVAVCTHAVMSMSKLWKFAFTGTGVSGALGERWAVMAVVTGLVIWDQESKSN